MHIPHTVPYIHTTAPSLPYYLTLHVHTTQPRRPRYKPPPPLPPPPRPMVSIQKKTYPLLNLLGIESDDAAIPCPLHAVPCRQNPSCFLSSLPCPSLPSSVSPSLSEFLQKRKFPGLEKRHPLTVAQKARFYRKWVPATSARHYDIWGIQNTQGYRVTAWCIRSTRPFEGAGTEWHLIRPFCDCVTMLLVDQYARQDELDLTSDKFKSIHLTSK